MNKNSLSKQSAIIEGIELHDALIDSFTLDFKNERLELSLSFYESADSSVRVSARIFLSEVSHFSSLLDVLSIKDNSISGNVTSWKLVGGMLYLYVNDGLITIKAGSIKIERA